MKGLVPVTSFTVQYLTQSLAYVHRIKNGSKPVFKN